MIALTPCEAGASCTQMLAWCGACGRIVMHLARGQPPARPGTRKPEVVPSHPFQGPPPGPEDDVDRVRASEEGALWYRRVMSW